MTARKEKDCTGIPAAYRLGDGAVCYAADSEERIVSAGYGQAFAEYQTADSPWPLLLHGDAVKALSDIPSDSVDCVMTSPPY